MKPFTNETAISAKLICGKCKKKNPELVGRTTLTRCCYNPSDYMTPKAYRVMISLQTPFTIKWRGFWKNHGRV